MDPRTPFLSAHRGSRANAAPVRRPTVKSPVGAQDNTSVEDRGSRGGTVNQMGPAVAQAAALRQPETPSAAWTGLSKDVQNQLTGGYQRGGFEGVMNAAGPDAWYDMPSYLRTQLLIGARG